VTRGVGLGELASAHGSELLGDGLVLLAAIAWVGYALVTSRMDGWSSLRVSTLTALPALVVILVVWAIAYLLGEVRIDAAALPGVTWRLAYVSLVGVVLGMFLWNAGLQRTGSVNAMLLLNLMPIVTFAIRASEGARFEAAEVVGAAIVVAALVANNLLLRRGAAHADAERQLREPGLRGSPLRGGRSGRRGHRGGRAGREQPAAASRGGAPIGWPLARRRPAIRGAAAPAGRLRGIDITPTIQSLRDAIADSRRRSGPRGRARCGFAAVRPRRRLVPRRSAGRHGPPRRGLRRAGALPRAAGHRRHGLVAPLAPARRRPAGADPDRPRRRRATHCGTGCRGRRLPDQADRHR